MDFLGGSFLPKGAEMNGVQNRRPQNIEKPFPGCMGRVVNLFDFGPGVVRNNKLLMDKPHQDDVVKKALDPTEYHLENKLINNELRRSSSNKKSNGTPMKMLIAQEMSKENESKQKPPGVVAKLMGLDALPGHQSNSTFEKCQQKGCLQNSSTQPGMSPRYLQHENGSPEHMQCGVRPFQDQEEYKDVYEVWQQSPNPSYIRDKSLQKGRYDEKLSERKMALVRQKFIEAKRLATDEKLRQSKEFQEALEVLSSNKELFLKFLQEPNSLFSQHLCELQSIPQLPHAKRITVLRPSNTMENNRFVGSDKMSRKHPQSESPVFQANVWDESKPRSNPLANQMNDHLTQPTRIVVLKPSPGKGNDIKAVASPLSPSSLHSKNFFQDLEDSEAQSSREVAKEITKKMRENLGRYQMEESLLSSALSNGYVGDESSFNRSDNEYIGEENLTDSETMTPNSRHSWDYVNRLASHCSSSFSRASYSPESSVCREAKKRLSERWAMMSSTGNGNGQSQRELRRSSSTLGEMLALSETNKSTRSNEEGIVGRSFSSSKSCGGEQELRGPTSSCLSSSKEMEEIVEEVSPRNLLRSRSVPVSSTAYGARLNVEVSDTEPKFSVPKEVERSKSVKSSFRGKVSSLFFSRNKKTSKEKSVSSLAGSKDTLPSANSEAHQVSEQHSPITICGDISQCVTTGNFEEESSQSPERSPSKTSSSASIFAEPKQRTFANEAVLSAAKTVTSGSQIENQEQPSPLSVLDAPFEDDNAVPESGSFRLDLQGPHLQPLKSNLIAKSPPIESLVRSLSWDDSCSDTGTPGPLRYPRVSSEAEEKQECLQFIQKLLSSLSLDSEECNGTHFARWHTAECPLDPLLIDEHVGLKDDKLQGSEAKRRQRRSNRRLIFDCVNATVVDASGFYGDTTSQCARMLSSVASDSAQVTVDEVWNQVKEWFSGDTKCFVSYIGCDNNSQVVENVVKTEVVGRGWVDLKRFELEGIQKEIEGKVLEELVEEVLFELTARLC